MSVLIAVLTVLLVICGLLVILLVMVQDDQGEGFALFGSSGQNPFNTGKNPLARMTGYLGIAFAVLAFLTAVAVSWSSNQRNRLEQLARPSSLEDNDWFLQQQQSKNNAAEIPNENPAALGQDQTVPAEESPKAVPEEVGEAAPEAAG